MLLIQDRLAFIHGSLELRFDRLWKVESNAAPKLGKFLGAPWVVLAAYRLLC
jgi:hypothetical protein